MKGKNEEKILKNTEIISDNTEEIKNVGVRNYNLEKHKRVWDALFYSHQRMDVLMISISGGGIYVCLEAIKFLNEQKLPMHNSVKASAILFVLAIIANFVSQMMSSYVYSCDYQITDVDVTCEEDGIDKGIYKAHIEALNKKSECFEKFNKIFSRSSIVLMALGLITLVYFFLSTF